MDQAVGAAAGTDTMAFRLADAERRLVGVRLVQHAGIPGELLDFDYDEAGRGWYLSLLRPPVWRLEYRLELRHADGGTEEICDPGNPRRVGGAFGDKSVLEFPDYREPGWLRLTATTPGSWRELVIPAPPVKGHITARIWSPAASTGHILLAHDGPEYDRLAALGHYSAALVGAGAVPAHHLVLLAPGDRDERYSASPAYSWALVADVLPRVHHLLGTAEPVVGMGASLGGLAMLHAQRRYPAAFAGLFLQSGSFFLPRLDRQESGFRRYLRIVRFIGKLHRSTVERRPAGPAPVPAHEPAPTVPTVLTCGLAEENLHNNREMAEVLRRQGYPVTMAEVPDAHNYTGWRDAFDPYLTELLKHVWG
jgi:enterochelin esterase family protein